MRRFLFISAVLIGGLFHVQLQAQDTLRNSKDGKYIFTVKHDIEANEVDNQNRTGTCWSFSALSFIESELIRQGKGKHNLSEMYVVRKAYEAKAERYVRMHGAINFGQGGAFHDIPFVIKEYGIVPQEVYKGLNYGLDKHNHSELEGVLKGMLDAVIKNRQNLLTTSWKEAVSGVLDAYLGPVPNEFEYKGKKYTPKTFASSLGLNMDHYVILTSFTHHPFYAPFVFEVPDNWMMEQAYNVPLNDFLQAMKGSVTNGYSVAWAADVSEKGFGFKHGLAIVPEDEDALNQKGKDDSHFNNTGAERLGSQFIYPGAEKKITQEMRQEAFDNYQSTDDHGMHITGLVTDQKGSEYFMVKNSWGTDHNDCDGYFFASMPYVAYKTMNIMIHKDALTKSMKKQLGL